MLTRRMYLMLSGVMALSTAGTFDAQAKPLNNAASSFFRGGSTAVTPTDVSARRRYVPQVYYAPPVYRDDAGLAFMGLAIGALGAKIADRERQGYYRQNYYYGGNPYYGGRYYGQPSYYGGPYYPYYYGY